MRSVETLIREAITKAGGPAALARELSLHRSEVTEFEKGRRPLTPACVARLGAYVDLPCEEVRRLTLEAVIHGAKPAWQATMRAALFQLLALGVGLSAATPHDAQAKSAAPTRVNFLYIVAHWLQGIVGPCRRLRHGYGMCP